jgi:hypothetical protein
MEAEKLAEMEESGVEAGAPRNDMKVPKNHSQRVLNCFITKRPIQFGEVLYSVSSKRI